MKRSPLHQFHVDYGARFTAFGDWEMPVQYESVLGEHRAVREMAGFFDVSHLGRFELTGPGALSALSKLLCNAISKIEPGRTQYTMMLNEDGGIIDDLIVWWWDEDKFWLLPNAANQDRVMAVFSESPGCHTSDLRDGTVMIALQGPMAPGFFEELLFVGPRRFRTELAELNDARIYMAGTGYTGERGGEFCTDPETADWIVRWLTDKGVTPCGLGARDTLRLEAGLALWGADIDETTTPLEANLDFAVSFEHDFVGREALSTQLKVGIPRSLIGLVMNQRGIPRHGYPVRTGAGVTGVVTSGNISPMLDTGIALAYVDGREMEPGAAIEVQIRDRWVPAIVAKPPFHRGLR